MHSAVGEALEGLMRARANAQRTHQARRLQISTVETVATRWLLPRIGMFMRDHPDIDIGLDITVDVRDFLRDNIDIAFRWGDGDYPGMRVDSLFEHSIFPVCSPKLIAEQGMPATPRDLLDYKLIHVFWSGKGVVWPDWR